MSNWMPDAVLPPIPFDGNSVVFRVKRMLVEDMNVVMNNYDRATGKLIFSSPEEMSLLAIQIVPKYLLAIDGLTRADGTVFTLETFLPVVPEAYFMPLVGGLLVGLMDVSVVRADLEKKPAAPLPEQPAASVAETPVT